MNRGALPKRIIRAARRRMQTGLAGQRPPALPDADSTAMSVLFVGGTGRSGTTVTGQLLGAHPYYAMIPIESKFISGPGGLCDLALGRTTFPEFREHLLGRRYRTRRDVGLHQIADRATLEAGLPRLQERLPDEPWAATAEYAHGVLDPIATAAGAKAWLDMNPGNVFRGRELLRMFPNMKLIHSVRDGRDVAASVVPLSWGPNDLDTALDWWARRIERGFAACEDLPPERVLVVQMEDLVARNREREYARLLAFAGLSDDPVMRSYFEDHVSEGRSHIGRWLEDVPPERLADFEAAHERVATALRNGGRAYAPLAARPSLTPVG